MKIKVNLWSFIFSVLCIALFIITVASSKMVESVTNLLHIDPLYIVLGMSIVTCLLGFVGFYEATNWRLFLRSILTIIITFGLSALVIFILGVDYLI